MHGLLTTTKKCNVFTFARRGRGVGKIPVRLESGERMRSRPELTTFGTIRLSFHTRLLLKIAIDVHCKDC